jgi:hypothetical protein
MLRVRLDDDKKEKAEDERHRQKNSRRSKTCVVGSRLDDGSDADATLLYWC